MDPIITLTISLVCNGILALLGWTLKNAYTSLKSENDKLWEAVDHIKANYFKRDEFSEFKKELRDQLIEWKEDIKEQIRELKK